MKVLVAGASRHGGTREIAAAIAEELRAAGFDADFREAGDVADLDRYGAVVLGSAVYAGGWRPEALRLVERHRAELAKVPLWLFSSGPLGADGPEPDGDPNRVAELARATGARGHRIFAGRLDRRTLGLGERLVAGLVGAPQGDFRDWEAIRAWTRQIAASLRAHRGRFLGWGGKTYRSAARWRCSTSSAGAVLCLATTESTPGGPRWRPTCPT
jgi:menaquinone-dependent protoporphyrinogen oxidase